MPKMKYLLSIAVLSLAILDSGCLRTWRLAGDQDKIVDNALSTVPLLRNFKNQYPESQHFITHHSGKPGDQIWNSKTPLYKRYILTMQIPMSITPDLQNVQIDGAPSFYVNEITAIADPDSRGQKHIYYGKSYTFDLAKWNRLLAAHGDFTAIGITLEKDKPVDGFGDCSGY